MADSTFMNASSFANTATSSEVAGSIFGWADTLFGYWQGWSKVQQDAAVTDAELKRRQYEANIAISQSAAQIESGRAITTAVTIGVVGLVVVVGAVVALKAFK